ncbi:DNA polymerase III beta chain [Vibrio phage 1.089.O._10N.261.51.F9]|nr:DNA polymerase III beta chain [Vibrio phage 1.012.O._10N.261.48.C12]AUR86789.1 DNA polymerase III beta chain [Vibrio phage 1.089.O._10N.261.51.F9]AUR87295.1 DNA polymerase III beta chain [Vibrio phage 1.098.O._10N.286.51.B9]AUR88810.1 DNA polymerase III beta chain [Vibrio phage 1.118.A._10N.261.49.F6]AUR88906.1 DNA polymerase III beta chain [Vibrio phage 1.118.B._10N.261.49.F6]AUR91400.1 DNA polymerase III beta chain [Vibrio phage 1.160.O._10N.261.48.B11]AUR97108.1 DNA polymerase III beta 
MIERLSQAIKAAKVFAAKKDIRYYLNGVALHIQGTTITSVVSSDGYCCCIIGNQELQHDSEVAIVSNEDVPVLLRALEGLPVGTSTVNGLKIDHMKLAIGDYSVPLVDGRFPDVRRIIPAQKRNAGSEIGINPDLLAKLKPFKTELCKHLTAGVRASVGSTMKAGEANEAIRFDFTNPRIDTATVIIQPMRL